MSLDEVLDEYISVNVEKTDDPILLNRYIPTDDRIYLYPDDRRVSVHVEKSDDRILLYQIVPPTDDRIYLYRDDMLCLYPPARHHHQVRKTRPPAKTIGYAYIRTPRPKTSQYCYIRSYDRIYLYRDNML